MSDEKKSILVAIVFGVIDTIFNIVAVVNSTNILFVIGLLLSSILLVALLLLYRSYKEAEDSYEFIKFLFFGSEYNGFSLFPKLKIFMDFTKRKNQVEVGAMEFECIDDVEKKCTFVQWTMKNVYNRTKREIKTYYLYTSNEYGKTGGVNIEVTEGDRTLNIDTDKILKKNRIQLTPFTFVEPLKPKSQVPEIKIKMEMQDSFETIHQKIVYLYPRNYGTSVKHINIKYKISSVESVKVKLHEIGKGKKGYFDGTLRTGVPSFNDEKWSYSFYLDENEVNVNNLYYLSIKAR